MALASTPDGSSAPEVRRLLGRVVAAALSFAAAVAIAALVSGSFDDTDWKVLGTTLGFSIFSATASAGASARLRAWPGAVAVGTAAVAASALALLLLVAALWAEAGDTTWRSFGVCALAAMALSHVAIVLGARRASDGPGIHALVAASVVFVAVDAIATGAPIAGIVDDVSDSGVRALAVCFVLLLLTTAIPPVLRRAAAAPAVRPPGAAATSGLPAERDGRTLAAELVAAADRIERGGAGGRGLDAEAEGLRALAREVERLR